MPSELQDRIARSMADKRRELIARPLSEIWPDLAEAALLEMREPTPEMVKAGVRHALRSSVSSANGWSDYISSKHRAMIDAEIALASGGTNAGR